MGIASKVSITDTGAAGADTVTSSGGASLVFTHTAGGSPGADVVNSNDLFSTITLGNSSVGNSVTTGAGLDSVTSGTGADTISTGAGNDTINAGGGKDVVNGGAGDDLIVGGAGTDSLTGGG